MFVTFYMGKTNKLKFFFEKKMSFCLHEPRNMFIFASVKYKTLTKIRPTMRRQVFDRFSLQALSELHRYRAVMFSPTVQ